MRVVVCDPGFGNVRSVVRAVEHAVDASGRSGDVLVTRSSAVVAGADFVIVPGQGSFGEFARAIQGGLSDALREHIGRGRPYLGICLGMQVLFESSEEAPGAAGLGIFAGQVVRLAPGLDAATGRPHPLPHIGWNAVESPGRDLRYFYFAHTYAAEPADRSVIAGTTRYGATEFTTMVARDSLLGVQFHPEKSQREGLDLLTRFFL